MFIDPISTPEYTGFGYILLDPVTGSGAYMISGGTNGGKDDILGRYGDSYMGPMLLFIGLLGLAGATFTAPFISLVFVLSLFHVVMTAAIIDRELQQKKCPKAFSAMILGLGVGLTIAGKIKLDALAPAIAGLYKFMVNRAVKGAATDATCN